MFNEVHFLKILNVRFLAPYAKLRKHLPECLEKEGTPMQK